MNPEHKTIAEAAAAQAAEDLKWIIHDTRGQRVLMRIIEHTGFQADPFDAENATRTAHNLGRQGVGKWLWAHLFNTDAAALWGALERYREQQSRLRDEEQQEASKDD